MSKASLQFGPGEMSGFTAYATASFNDTPPAKIVRELLQNALDAGVAAGERTTHVRFEVVPLAARDVPDMAGYKRAFSEAVRDNRRFSKGKLPDAAQHVVDTIEDALGRLERGEHFLLSVMDNGIGLNQERMTSLLGDGSSAKPPGAAGSYGVGHFAAVSASDLRYLLYGGVLKGGKRIASGFAILAGRAHRTTPRSSRGYLVKKLLGGAKKKLYQFIDQQDIPPVIDAVLSRVRQQWGHGSVVMIPAFNYFGRDWRLADVITRVTAYNFSAAIHAGELVVEVDETAIQGRTSQRLDRNNLGDILERDAERVRRFRSDSAYHGLRPSGQHAWATYQALAHGKTASVQTGVGTVLVQLLTPTSAATTRMDLFRNGMWITDDVPELGKGVFADWHTFHAVLTPAPDGELHRLVRKAEGPMHDSLAITLLDMVEREQLRTAFRAVAGWLKTQVPKNKAETFTPDDFLVVASGDDDGGGSGASYSMWGSPVVVHRARLSQRRTEGPGRKETDVDSDQGTGRRTGNRRNRESRTARSRPLPFRSTGVPGERGRYNIEIEVQEAVQEVLLRFRIDENADATSDRLWPDEDVVVRSFEATDQDGTKLAGDLEDGNRTIRLYGMAASKYKVTIEYETPLGFDDAVQSPVFRMDFHKP